MRNIIFFNNKKTGKMKKGFFALTTMFAAFMTLSCSTSRKSVSLSEYQAMVDSVCMATGTRIYVDSFMYRRFPVRRENMAREREVLSKAARDTCGFHTVERSYDGAAPQIWHRPDGTVAEASKRAWKSEMARRDKRNRVTWKEYLATVRDSMPEAVPLGKKEWKRQRMTRAELQAAVRSDRILDKTMTGTFVLERDSAGRTFTRRVTDSAELAEIKARRYRWNSVADGMLGAAYTEKPFVGLAFGAEGYKLSDTETLWLKVHAGNCHPFPSAKPTCEISDYDTYVNVEKADGSDETVYIKVRDPQFRLLQNPPFRYTFTANFEYGGRWYYVFMCDDPLGCVCKPIDVPRKEWPLL